MKHQFPLFLILIQTFAISMACAQTHTPESGNIDPCLDERGNAYMDRQSDAFLQEVQEILGTSPPQYPEPRERQLGLLLLDAVLHDKYAAHRTPVQQFYRSRMLEALRSLQTTTVGRGATVWKLYNMGFIVRTKSVTLAFDFNSGEAAEAKGFGLTPDIVRQFVRECDVLFISHRHRDHAEKAVARMFLGQSKPVIAPPQVWKGEPIHDSIAHFTRVAHEKQRLVLASGKPDLEVVIYPGHQMRRHENNVSLVFTPEGITIAHMGDQINEGDFIVDYAWIDEVKEHHDVDILFPPCWTNEIYRIVQGFDPNVVIPGHENELGHPVDDRVPYWGDSEYLELTYPQLKASVYPVMPMVWGEQYHYSP